MGSLVFQHKKICSRCGSGVTNIQKRFTWKPLEKWYYNLGKDKPICHNCYQALFSRPKRKANLRGHQIDLEAQRRYRQNRFDYAGTEKHSTFRALTGYCSNCPRNLYDGTCKRTQMHHALGYFATLPWFGRVELCSGCHNRTHNWKGLKRGPYKERS